jgi:pimeloyl-ACP methyl ester carboxylesterase
VISRTCKITQGRPAIVLVHGAFHGSWCWERVAPRLAVEGIRVESFNLPFAGRLKHDVAALRRAMVGVGQDLIVCAHSYGGLVATLAASELDHVRHLVYIAGYMLNLNDPDAWTLLESLAPAAGTSMSKGDVDPTEARAMFYHDCDDTDARAAIERLRSMPITQRWWQMTSIVAPAYAAIPSTYVICTDDRALSPAGQRVMARAATYSLELHTGHSAFYTAPDAVVELLVEICTHGRSRHARAALAP